MSVAPPPIVSGDLAARTRELAERYSAWRSGRGDFGDGLVDAFTRLAEVVAARINSVPDKNFLAFLDLVGVTLLSPRPARVPLTFELAAGTPASVVVPAATEVAATPAEGEAVPPTFETQGPLVATPGRLAAVISLDADRDRYRDNTLAAAPEDDADFDVFAGVEPLGHVLYLADERLGISARKDVDVAIGGRDETLPWPPALRWSYWDGVGWSELAPSSPPAGAAPPPFADAWLVTFADLPPVQPTTVGNRTARVLRAVLPTPVPRPRAGGPATTIGEAGLALDAAFADGERLDFDVPEVPFDDLEHGTFFLASVDAFSKPGATARISIRLDPARPAGVANAALAWKYPTEGGWTELTDAGDDFEDTTYALSRSGEVRFRVPSGWLSASVNGVEGWWLKAEIASGSYELSQPPYVESATVAYEWSLPETNGLELRARVHDSNLLPDLAFANQTPIDLNKDYFPFGEKPVLNDTLYVAADAAFAEPSTTILLDVTLTNQSNEEGEPGPAKASSDLVLRWEYWDQASERWELLGTSGPGSAPDETFVVDATKAFTTAGTIVVKRPPTMGRVTVNGEVRHWIRARIAAGNYGVEARYRETTTNGERSFELVLDTFRPPSIRSLRVEYRRTLDWEPFDAVLAENAFAVDDVTTAARRGSGAPLRPYVPGEDEQSALYLGFDRPFPDAYVALYLGVIEPIYSPRRPSRPPGEPPAVVWEYWSGAARSWRHLHAEDETNAFTRRGLLSFVGPAGHDQSARFGRELWWLRARNAGGRHLVRPRLARVLTNTTWAEHATTVRDAALGSGTGERNQSFHFVQTPVLDGQQVEVRELELPRAEEIADLGDGAVRTVRDPSGRVVEVWVRWREVVDFYASGPRSRHYVLDHLDGTIRFGDGVRGLPPPQGRDNVIARLYRTGGGTAGNRGAHTVTGLTTTIPFVAGATNHEPAAGGTAAETLEQARERGPRLLRHGDRAVVAADFEDLAVSASPTVARVRAFPVHSQDDLGRVVVVVVPRSEDDRPAPSVELLNDVAEHLRQRAAPAFDVVVTGPGWIRVDVAAEVVPRSLEGAADVESAIRTRLERFLHPLHGGVDGAGWPFGRRPHRSDLYAVIEAVEGVDHVRSLDVDESTVELPLVAAAFLAYSGEHAVSMAGGD